MASEVGAGDLLPDPDAEESKLRKELNAMRRKLQKDYDEIRQGDEDFFDDNFPDVNELRFKFVTGVRRYVAIARQRATKPGNDMDVLLSNCAASVSRMRQTWEQTQYLGDVTMPDVSFPSDDEIRATLPIEF